MQTAVAYGGGRCVLLVREPETIPYELHHDSIWVIHESLGLMPLEIVYYSIMENKKGFPTCSLGLNGERLLLYG